MLSQEELDAMVEAEEKRLGVGSKEFIQRHNEIIEPEGKERRQMAKQIMNVRDVMAVLEVSESKAYGIIRQMNDELKAKGFITIPGKVSTAFFEEKVYGVHAE